MYWRSCGEYIGIMKYFVTGATGFVGGRLVRQLVIAGHRVVALVRDPAKAADLAGLGILLHRGDVTDKESMRVPMTGADGVFHVAGWYKVGVRDKKEGEKINIQGTRNVLELMRDLKIPKGVYTSTLAVNSDTHGQLVDETYRFSDSHLSEYDRTKAVAHDIASAMIARGLPLVIVMPGLIYGPGDSSSVRSNFIQYLQRKLPLIPRTTEFSWAHVDDIAAAHVLAMERGRSGEAYIVAGERHSFVDALALAHDITGVPAPMSAPAWVFKVMSVLVSSVEKILPVPQAYSSEALRIIAGVSYIGDNAKAKRELGYDPRPLRSGLTETLRHEMKLLGMTPPVR